MGHPIPKVRANVAKEKMRDPVREKKRNSKSAEVALDLSGRLDMGKYPSQV